MVRGSFLIGVLVSLGSACSGLGSFEVYCRNSGACACLDGACCAFEGKSCEDLECCDGAACISGQCGTPIRLTLTPRQVDFGEVRSLPSPARTVRVTNTSRDSAAVRVTFEGEYELEGTDCPELLAPDASCRLQVRVKGPSVRAELLGTVHVEEATPRSVGLRAATGRLVVIQVDGPVSVTSDPAGLSCPGQCEAAFPFDAAVDLVHSELPYGHWLHADLWCDSARRVCPLAAEATRPWLFARTNLTVWCIGPGAVWMGSDKLCSRLGAGISEGGKAMFGPAELEARPHDESASIQWMGVCTGVQGTFCSVQVSTSTWVLVEFK